VTGDSASPSGIPDPMKCGALEFLDEHSAALPPVRRWPETLRHLVDVLASYNERGLRMSHKQAADDAAERVFLIADYLGGRNLYLPRGAALRRAARDALIFRLVESLPKDEVCRMWGLSEIYLYKIIAEQKRLTRGARDGQ